MSLARTAVRLSVVSALTNATLAGNRVYDSQIVDFDPQVYLDGGKPAITVLSDQDDGEALSQQNGGPPFRRMIEIVVEMTIIQTISADGLLNPETNQPYPPGTYFIETPDSDARSEASLDFLEWQVIRRLSFDDNPACVLFRSFNRIVKSECHRQTADGTAQKVASRVLTLTCDTQDDEQPNLLGPTLEGIAGLPVPLRAVCEFFDEGTEGYKICMGIVDATIPLTPLSPLDEVDVVIDGDPDADNGGSDEIHFKADLTE